MVTSMALVVALAIALVIVPAMAHLIVPAMAPVTVNVMAFMIVSPRRFPWLLPPWLLLGLFPWGCTGLLPGCGSLDCSSNGSRVSGGSAKLEAEHPRQSARATWAAPGEGGWGGVWNVEDGGWPIYRDGYRKCGDWEGVVINWGGSKNGKLWVRFMDRSEIEERWERIDEWGVERGSGDRERKPVTGGEVRDKFKSCT